MPLTRRRLISTAPAALAAAAPLALAATVPATARPAPRPLVEAAADLDRILAKLEEVGAELAKLYAARPRDLDIEWSLKSACLKGVVSAYMDRAADQATVTDLCHLIGRWCAEQEKRCKAIDASVYDDSALEARETALWVDYENLRASILDATPATPEDAAAQARVRLRGIADALAAGDPVGAAHMIEANMAALAAGTRS